MKCIKKLAVLDIIIIIIIVILDDLVVMKLMIPACQAHARESSPRPFGDVQSELVAKPQDPIFNQNILIPVKKIS